MALSDEEQDVPSANLTGGRKPSETERVRLEATMNDWALMQEKRQQVLLRLIVASSSAGVRLGLDLAVVLDVSGEKLAKMKTVMHYIIRKLSPTDRLCIVGITNELLFMTKAGRTELRRIVDGGLVATNLRDGLQIGLDVLAGRQLGTGGARTASVLLMSDCKQNPSPRVVETMAGNVVVHTFGFGQDHDSTLLEKIARNSHGGTFNFVRDDEKYLSGPISQALAGLLSVVVQDLKLTMWTETGRYREMESKIEKVDGGISYPPAPVDADGCITVSFGDLYSGEDRKVIVDILLPAVGWGAESTIIMARCSYSNSTQREAFVGSPKAFHPEQSSDALPGPVPPALTAELLRRRYADMLSEASTMGYAGAQGKLDEACRALEAEKTNRMIGIRNRNALEPNPMIGILEAELEFLKSLNQWGELHACLLAAIMSHCRQRFATRGDVLNVRLFDTPLMRLYLVQAHKFEDNPTIQLTSADQDVEEEEEEKGRPVVSGQRTRSEPLFVRQSGIGEQDRSSRCDWVLLILATVQAIGAILASAVVLAVFLLYKSKMSSLV